MEQQHAQIVDEFYRMGVVHIPNFLTSEECTELRRKTDETFEKEAQRGAERRGDDMILRHPLVYDRTFANLFMREPVLSLAEAILGPECRFCGQNVIRNHPGQAISHWHIDDCNILDFPLPDDVPRHDARIRLPVYWFSVQVPLSDVETLEAGPTEVVRSSHYSGRLPPTQENPEFDGYGPEPIFCNAGDAYLFNHQIWHRGRPNQSENTRYLLQIQYSRGGTHATRFQGLVPNSPFEENQLDEVLDGADERMLRVLGRTPPTYGL